MSGALADVLIDLADPEELEKFNDDEDAYLSQLHSLTEMDKAALKSRKGGWIRHQAKEGAPEIIEAPYDDREITAGPALDVIDVIDVVDVVVLAEIEADNNDKEG